MQLFYFPRTSDNTIELPADESRHLVKVLRKKVGDIVHATDGEGFLIEAKLLDENHRGVRLEKLKEEKQPERTYEFTLAIAPVKNNDRLEWCIEKATEIGVTRIVPILCEHAERKKIKLDRLERIAISAMKQSNQFYKPQIEELTKFKDFIEERGEGERYIAHCEEDQPRRQFVSQVKSGVPTTILIGPEGDFSPDEIEQALESGFGPVALGNTRLRTETAAVVSATIVASKNAF
ncbi:16S rRNA (uracil(1498)-N(3))-methyltransferase [Halocola ammonii]